MCTTEHTYPHTAIHNSSIHTENGFRDVPVVVADRGKRSDQSATMYSVMSALSPFNHRIAYVGRVSKNQNPENMFQILTSTRRLPLSPSSYFHFSLYPSRPLNLHLADPKDEDFPFSVQSTILYIYGAR